MKKLGLVIIFIFFITSCGTGTTSHKNTPPPDNLKDFWDLLSKSNTAVDNQVNIEVEEELNLTEFKLVFYVDDQCLYPISQVKINGEVQLNKIIYSTNSTSSYFLCSNFSYGSESGCASEANLTRSIQVFLSYNNERKAGIASSGCLYNQMTHKELIGDYQNYLLTSCVINGQCGFSKLYAFNIK